MSMVHLGAVFRDNKNDEWAKKLEYYLDYKKRPLHMRGTDCFEVETNGLKVIVINDKDSNFLPIISLNTSPFTFDWQHDALEKIVLGELEASVNFFNVRIGKWEPFIEKFTFLL